MSEIDIANKLHILSEKMDRYESHREQLRKDVKTVSDRQNEMITLIAGSDLNNKKGILSLLDEVDKRTRIIETENKLIQKDIDNTKFWGRTATGMVVAVILVIINAIKDRV